MVWSAAAAAARRLVADMKFRIHIHIHRFYVDIHNPQMPLLSPAFIHHRVAERQELPATLPRSLSPLPRSNSG